MTATISFSQSDLTALVPGTYFDVCESARIRHRYTRAHNFAAFVRTSWVWEPKFKKWTTIRHNLSAEHASGNLQGHLSQGHKISGPLMPESKGCKAK
jgi:hypothetical protein